MTGCLPVNLRSAIYAVLDNRQNTDWETDGLPGRRPGDFLGGIDLQFFQEFAVSCPLPSLAVQADASAISPGGLSLGAPS